MASILPDFLTKHDPNQSGKDNNNPEKTETVEKEENEQEEEEVEPAYDLSNYNKVRFNEVITIDTEDETNFATITIETIANDITFDVRIAGYTSRFGELDVEYISGGGYAINLYHPLPDSDEYFVRRLYYYANENGVGSEQHRENMSKPTETVWSRSSDFGSSIQTEFQSTYLTVYDWRQNMLTHNKPTPKDEEVIIRYEDSLRAGGNGRGKIDNRFNVSDLLSIVGDSYTVQFISIDMDTSSYILHSKTEGGETYHIYAPIDKKLTIEDCEIFEAPKDSDPFEISDVIWTREPEDTWAIEGFDIKEKSN